MPTPFDAAKTPVLDFVRDAAATVGARLRRGQLVILQSTTYPGTTEEIVRPILEERSGLRAGVDFHLAYSPERVDPANTTWTLANTPKVCGGVTPECGEMTRVLLSAILDDPSLVTVVSSPKVAEMAKLVENTYRAVNIAYVNELAMLAHEMDVDIWEVMEAAATKPFGFQPFLPGIGPGGQCIPVNPYYISWKAREFDFHTSFIELAGDINLRMTNYVMHRIHSFTTRLGVALAGAQGAVPRRRVQGRGERRAQLPRGQGDGAAAARRRRRGVRRSARRHAHRSTARELTAVPARRSRRRRLRPRGGAGAQPAWPVDALLAAGVPTFDAVNALEARQRRHPRTPVTVRVLWLINGLGPGGAERLLVEQAHQSDHREFHYEVAYVLDWKQRLVPELEALGVTTHSLGVRTPLDPRWTARLAALLHREQFDVVHAHSPLVGRRRPGWRCARSAAPSVPRSCTPSTTGGRRTGSRPASRTS